MRLGHIIRIYGFLTFDLNFAGGDSGREIPVPIPNTEVKSASADGTDLETDWESRTPPVFLRKMNLALSIMFKIYKETYYIRRKCGVVITSFVFLFFNSHQLKAHPLNVSLSETTIVTDEFKITYENYKRNTQFFYGHIKEIHFKNYFLNYSDRISNFKEYHFGFFVGDVDVDGRKSVKRGYGARIGVSGDIWGDLVIFPLWKYYAGISGGLFNLSKYQSNDIDIDYKFLSFNLSILCSKSFGNFIPYAGIRFFYNIDEFRENKTNVFYSGSKSGFSPFIGVKVPVMSRFSIQLTSEFIDERGYSLSIGYLW